MNPTEPEPILHDYARQAAEVEREIAAATSDLILSEAVAVIREHPEWDKFTARLGEIYDGLARSLVRKRLDSYDLGFHQGYARALSAMLSQKPLSQQEVDQIRTDISIQAERLADLRKILA